MCKKAPEKLSNCRLKMLNIHLHSFPGINDWEKPLKLASSWQKWNIVNVVGWLTTDKKSEINAGPQNYKYRGGAIRATTWTRLYIGCSDVYQKQPEIANRIFAIQNCIHILLFNIYITNFPIYVACKISIYDSACPWEKNLLPPLK